MAKTTVPQYLSATTSIIDSGDATAITIDGSENVAIGGGTNHDGAALLISHGDSGVTTFSDNADELVIENSSHAGISILTPNNASGSIIFGDSDDDDIGKIVYAHDTDDLTITAADDINLTTGSGNVGITGTMSVSGAVTANAGVVVDNITIDGTEIDLSSGSLTVDVAGDITLDADGGDIWFKDGGTAIGQFRHASSSFIIKSNVTDNDLILRGDDGGSAIDALTFDMSDAGTATFNHDVVVGGNISLGDASGATITMNDTDGSEEDFAFVLGANALAMRKTSNSNDIMRLDLTNERVGIGTASPDAQFHNEASAVTNVHYDTGATTIIEATENVVQLTAADSGNNACALILSTAPSSGNNKHWIFHHGGTSKGDRLDIGFGESSSTGFDGRGDIAADITINTDGHVGLGVTNVGDMHANFRNLIVGTGSGNEGISIYSGAGSEGAIGFARDCANNTDAYDGLIEYSQADRSFRFGTNAGTERMRLKTGLSIGSATDPGSQNLFVAGVVRVGDNSPSIAGHITVQGSNAGVPILYAKNTNADSLGIRAEVNNNTSNNAILEAVNTDGQQWKIRNDGDHFGTDTSIGSISDSRLKKDVSDLTYDIAKFKQYRPVEFNWINPNLHRSASGKTRGFLAQEVKALDDYYVDQYDAQGDDIPLVDSDGKAHSTKFGYKDAMYISVIKQLITRLETAEAKIAELESS